MHRAFRDDSGQALVIVALGMVTLIAFLGLAVDTGQLRAARRQLQTQADAVALAAALELQACNGSRNCAAMQAAASDALTENGAAAVHLTTACEAPAEATSGVTSLGLNNPPCALGAQDGNAGNTAFVEAVVSRTQPTHFAGVLGFSSVAVSARAEASLAPATSSGSARAAVLVQ